MDSEKKFVVDQIIDDIAVLEDQGVMVNVPLTELPDEIHDGSILILDSNGYHVNVELENNKKEELKARLERLKALKKDE